MSKLNNLIQKWPDGTVAIQSWLDKLGISRQLAQKYCESQWIKRIGYGAYVKMGDDVSGLGVIYSLQFLLNYQIHVAAGTALAFHSYIHNISFANENLWLFKSPKEFRHPPKWTNYFFKQDKNVHFMTRNLFKNDDQKDLQTINVEQYKIIISSPERAVLESIDLTPSFVSIEQIFLIFQSMTTLRPDLMQKLLMNCHSIKVKRLFLLIAEHHAHQWFSRLNLNEIDIGVGKRVIGSGGHYYEKYQLYLPIDLNQL